MTPEERAAAKLVERLGSVGESERDRVLRGLEREKPGVVAIARRILNDQSGTDPLVEPEPLEVPSYSEGMVIDEFELRSFLGGGEMGQVWAAKQQSLDGRHVALKLWARGSVRQFEQEGLTGAKLAHPGIAAVHKAGQTDDGVPYIAQELVEGESLVARIETIRKLSTLPSDHYSETVKLFVGIGNALQEAHDKGVVHCDLKPGNIMRRTDGSPVIVDFGMARVAGGEASLGYAGVGGTIAYMSPEQVRRDARKIGPQSDIFSLGVVLYEYLALRRPFDGDDSVEIAGKILSEDPLSIRKFRSQVPADLCRICEKAIQKDPAQRYESVRMMVEDLVRYTQNKPIRARPPTAHYQAWKWTRRYPARVALTAGLISTIGFWMYSQVLAARETKRSALVMELAATRELDILMQEAEEGLWPVSPSLIDAYVEWIGAAQSILDRSSYYRNRLESLEKERSISAGKLGSSGDAGPGRTSVLAASEAGLTTRVASPSSASGIEIDWWAREMAGLVTGLRILETELLAETVTPVHGWSVSKRLSVAMVMRDRAAPGGVDALAWDAVLDDLQQDYGCVVPLQTGLFPLGPDPDTGLWEFAFWPSGAVPGRDEDDRLVIGEETSMVFVLLPGRQFHMGAGFNRFGPNWDPQIGRHESPVTLVELSPFFISKYEMTQGQWWRLAGINHATYQTTVDETTELELTHPIEGVSWDACHSLLTRFGLSLPTEAQWEFAARGGTEWPWSTGSEKESLAGAANLADQSALALDATWTDEVDDWPELDDGHGIHAPVGSYFPNPFGLHDVHGNVGEWVLDEYKPYTVPPRGGDGYREQKVEGDTRVIRGGSFSERAKKARSAAREGRKRTSSHAVVGVRPARKLHLDG